MLKILLKVCWLIFFGFGGLMCFARQLHSVADGSWNDPQVWYNQLIPGSTYDTIEVTNHLNLNSTYLVLAKNDLLKVDSGASVCGIDTFEMFDNARLLLYGYLATNCFNVTGNYNIEFIGPTGMLDVGYGGVNGLGQFTDSLGCFVVHLGNAHCNYTCAYDSNIFLHYNGALVTFEADSNALPENYVYLFGDGSSSGKTTWYQVHEYNDTGYYYASVILFPCCAPETLSVTVHVIALYTGLLPEGWCNIHEHLVKNAVPVTSAIYVSHSFCSAVQGSVKLYGINGALIYNMPFSGNELNEVIPANNLVNGCYLLSIETSEGAYRQKLIIDK